MTVWAEGVFLLNAALDYALLAGAVRLRGGRPGKRLIAAALLGGAMAVAALYPAFQGGGAAAAGLLLLSACAYGISLEGLRMSAVFLGLSLALCGVQTALSLLPGSSVQVLGEAVWLRVSWQGLTASAVLLYGVCAALSGAVSGKRSRLVSVQAAAAGRTAQFRCLLDTGSFLRDPLSGKGVILADGSVAELLLRLDPQRLSEPAALLERLLQEQPELRPRLIPYRAVGVEQGMLLGIRCSALTVDGEARQGGILAFAPGHFSDDGSYHGLMGG